MTRTCRHPQESAYERDLDRNDANFAALTPLGFLERSADIYPGRTAVIHGPLKRTYGELRQRCRRLASALARRGIVPGDTVSIIAPNIPAMVEVHYGVPMAGAVLNALNYRLDAATLAYILDHSETRILFADSEFAAIVREALSQVQRPVEVIDIDDPEAGGAFAPFGGTDYEEFLASGDEAFEPLLPADEWQAISLNYTSGTTGHPKGVVYHHRGAYLNAVGNVLTWGMGHAPVYLWTLPMFHCNGWCFPWTICLQAGTHVCLRRVEAGAIYRAIAGHGVTHLCGAPIVMSMIVNAGEEERQPFDQKVRMMTAASAPPAAVLEKMERIGIEVTHVYGLTEVYGPATVCAVQDEWAGLDSSSRADRLARQGVRYPVLEGLAVMDPETMSEVPDDGSTLGEIMMRGHDVMKGYLKNPQASAAAFAGGWFHTGDLAVRHADGYVEIRDRSKDIIISGGENISSIEVEGALYRHPAVLEAAIVARPDERWGETPCAFVTLKAGASADAGELQRHCREHIAGYKVPKTFVFGPLPKTSTGKVQ
ncbi:MAG: acyl-CoA synthetase, partial [Geminicoccaceae bacterium]|nr:acyl-CoA synthetase [Geminicoccaceae bacterium]